MKLSRNRHQPTCWGRWSIHHLHIQIQYLHQWSIWWNRFKSSVWHTVQITFIFIGQTHLVFGKRVCTCVTKHSNAFQTFLNWLKNSKRVWNVWHVWHVWNANFDVICTVFSALARYAIEHTGIADQVERLGYISESYSPTRRDAQCAKCMLVASVT